ncbi:MAG: alpha/beta hydrolase, partial [Akkermansiaceae bacterium]
SRYGGHAFGLKPFDKFLANRDSIKEWIAEYSPYANVTKGDPPVYLTYNTPPAIGKAQKDPTHTSNFGVKLQEHCQANGVACELFYPNAPDVKHKSTTEFLITTLKKD